MVEAEVLPEFADEAEAWLLGLGGTVEEIHQSLLRLGLKGDPEAVDDCVLLRGLRKAGLPVSDITTGFHLRVEGLAPRWVPGEIRFDTHPTATGQHVPAALVLPPVADDFANRFDLREFPDLVDESVAAPA